ncbi:MAG: C40 family peptidase [Chitinophagaceae bacterium]|nr:C40 family peptidase [Chitinophagaceae bacterium]
MAKNFIAGAVLCFLLTGCSALRQLPFANDTRSASSNNPVESEFKFLNHIQVRQSPEDAVSLSSTQARTYTQSVSELKNQDAGSEVLTRISSKTAGLSGPSFTAAEYASPVQLKYAVLLDTELEHLPSRALLEAVDEWYGVRYRKGGVSKKGVDCSGFTMSVYQYAYGVALPRVSRDQYRFCRKISLTELQEGDLLFFNTTGRGVSHVGIYLGNNRFIHASVSRGVMVNNIFENYYIKRFIAAGRVENKSLVATGQ